MVRRFTRRKKSSRTRNRGKFARSRGFIKRKRRQASRVFRRTGKVTKWMRKRKNRSRIEWKKMRDFIAMDASALYSTLSQSDFNGVFGDSRVCVLWSKILAIPDSGTGPSQFIGRKLGYMKYKMRLTAKLTPTVWYPPSVGNTGAAVSGYVPIVLPTQCSFRILVYQVKSGGQATASGGETVTAPNTSNYHPMYLPDLSATFTNATTQQSSGVMIPGSGTNVLRTTTASTASYVIASAILSNIFQYVPTPSSATTLGSEFIQGTDIVSGLQNNEIYGPTAQYTSLLRGQLRDGFTKSATVLYDKVFSLGTHNGRSQLQKKISFRGQPYQWQETEGTESSPSFKMEDWPVNAIYMMIIPIFNQYTSITPPGQATASNISYGRLDIFGNSELIFTDP